MKRCIPVFCAALLLLSLTGCQPVQEVFFSSADAYVSPDLAKLVSLTPIVITAQVDEVLPCERVTMPPQADANVRGKMNFTPYRVTVQQPLKGKFNAGDSFTLTQYGGKADGVNEVWEGMRFLEKGKSYLLFIYETHSPGMVYPYSIAVPYSPSPGIVDGLVRCDEKYFHIPDATPLEEALQMVSGAVGSGS